MEPELIRQEMNYFRCIGTREASREEKVEALIPDVMGDAAEILDTQAAVFLRSKESEDGLVRLRGSLEGNILYRTVAGELCALPFKSECRVEWTGEELQRDMLLCAELYCTGAEARILNPRKLLMSCELNAQCSLWCAEKLNYVSAVADGSMETRCETQNVRLISAVLEKTFALTESFPLREGSAAVEEILLSRCESRVEEAHSVAGKLILQGKSELELLYADEEQQLHTLCFSSGWSQLLDCATEPGSTQIRLMPTALYVDGINGGTDVSLELHLTAQVICSESREVLVLTDAYSVSYAAELKEAKQLFQSYAGEAEEMRIQCSVKAPEELEEILFCRVEPGAHRELTLHLLYRDTAGAICSYAVPLSTEAEERICRDCSASVNGGNIELRLSFMPETSACEECTLCWIDAISLDEEKPLSAKKHPGLVAVRRSSGSYWELARKYGSTVTLIEQANAEMDEKDLFLFIPRAR